MDSFQPAYDAESIPEQTSFSAVALVGLLASLAGILTIFRLQALPFALIGVALGGFALARHRRWNLSRTSTIMAFLAVAIAIFAGCWGVAEKRLEEARLIAVSKKVSMEFIGLLVDGKNDAAFRLSKSQLDVLNRSDEAAMMNTLEMSQKNVDDFLRNPGAAEVIRRGKKAKWEFVSVKNIIRGPRGIGFDLLFRDASVPNSKKLLIRAMREIPRDGHPNEYLWSVPECDWDR